MRLNTMYALRGLPSSGKTTLAKHLTPCVVAADDYFYENGEIGVYDFDPSKLGEAHAQCQQRAEAFMEDGVSHFFAVTNTFTCRWELEPYLKMASKHGWQVVVIDLFDGGLTDEELAARGTHGVPAEGIRRMRERYEHCWRTGDPLHPMDRGRGAARRRSQG